MNILQIAPAWIDTPPKEYGGTEQVIYNLVQGLHNHGHQVTLYATKKSKSPGKLKYLYKKSFVDQDLPWEACLPALAHYHQAFQLAANFDIVHTHLSSPTDLMLLPFLADLADQHIPATMTIHGHFPFDKYTHSDNMYLNLYGPKIFAINISEAMRPSTPPQFHTAGVIHNSLFVSKLKFYSKRGNYLTWLGKIVPDKNVSEAILTAKAAGIPIVFGGVVDKHNPRSIEYFETKVKPLINGKDVVYVGPVKDKDKSRLLGNAMAFLYPIVWAEPFGMVMVEAMATGTPVIAYPRGAAPELVIDGENGFIVPNRIAMLQAITKINTIDRRDCRAHVKAKYDPTNIAREHLAVYSKVIQKYVGTPAVRPLSQSVTDFVDSLDYLFRNLTPVKKSNRSTN